MTSRMQLLLDTLAARYRRRYNRKLTVLVAWADYAQPLTGLSDVSLHYEGEHTIADRIQVLCGGCNLRCAHHCDRTHAHTTHISVFPNVFPTRISLRPDEHFIMMYIPKRDAWGY